MCGEGGREERGVWLMFTGSLVLQGTRGFAKHIDNSIAMARYVCVCVCVQSDSCLYLLSTGIWQMK